LHHLISLPWEDMFSRILQLQRIIH